MDTVPGRGGTVINEQDSSQLAKLEAQVVQQGKCQSPKLQVPKDVIRCDDCGQIFIELAGLLRHKQRDHTLRKPHRCHACGQEFALLSSLQLHKHSNATLSCQFCQRVFPCTTSLSTHLLQQHAAIPESQGLEGQPFNYLFNQQDGGPYACAPCGKFFWQKPALLQHQQAGCYTLNDLCRPWPHTSLLTVPSLTPQAHTPPSLPSSSAPIALTSLPLAHLPPSPIRLHLCSLCPRDFRTQSGLTCHQRFRHPMEWKRAQSSFWKQGGAKFSCPSCDKAFCHSPSLSRHRARFHMNTVKRRKRIKRRTKSQFPCRSCDMVFSQTSKLYLHRKEQHRRLEGNEEQMTPLNTRSKIREKSDPAWGPASEIGGGTAGKGERRRVRVYQEHGECQEKGDDGTFPCPSCEEVFSQHSALKEHEEVHQSMGGLGRCSVCSHGMDSFRRMGRKVAGFYHCMPCKHAFRTLTVFLKHCQMHLLPCKDEEGGADSSDLDD